MTARQWPLEAYLALYFTTFLPNVVVTALLTRLPHGSIGRPLTGLEILPASLVMNMVLTYLFIWWSGWHRHAHGIAFGAWRLPVPTLGTLVSGIGTALIIFTVPLSFTFKGVSIPFIQLLMRGDILLIAPLVDLLFRRRVHWWSWTALSIVALALLVTLHGRGGLALPPLAMLTVGLYTLGYFLRLAMMTRIGKTGRADDVRGYFVEEKILALPLAIGVLAILSALGLGGQADELRFGFVQVWTDPVVAWLAFLAVTLTLISIYSLIILLDPRENAFCVPIERAGSLVAGVVAAFILAAGWGLPAPAAAEVVGVALLIAAVLLLFIAPRMRAAPAH